MKEKSCKYYNKEKCDNNNTGHIYCPYWRNRFCPDYIKTKTTKKHVISFIILILAIVISYFVDGFYRFCSLLVAYLSSIHFVIEYRKFRKNK